MNKGGSYLITESQEVVQVEGPANEDFPQAPAPAQPKEPEAIQPPGDDNQ